MAPEVPAGKTAVYLFVTACKYGHEWFTYGEDQTSHWGPAQCRVCLEPTMGAKVVKKLTPEEVRELKTYHLIMDARLALKTPIVGLTEEDVDADSVRETVSQWEFLVGDIVVQRFPKNWLTTEPRVREEPPAVQTKPRKDHEA
jgi:hypothetical protein